MNNQPRQPQNQRSKTTGKLELRKLWNVPKAEFIYALFLEIETETCEMKEDECSKMVPDWDKIQKTETSWQTPQGYVGDEEWAKKTAEHFEIEFPKEEYKGDEPENTENSKEA